VLHTFEASVREASAAREKHFPRWQRAIAAAVLLTGLALLVASMMLARPLELPGRDALALADICYMTGFLLVVFELLYLPWVAIRLPAAPTSAARPR
jgi:protein-S-isoprenylcysteine O-methyltransferase Ste14